MNEEDLLSIEEETGFELPESYRRVMLNYPESLLHPNDHPLLCVVGDELFSQPEYVIHENLQAPESSLHWPDEYLIIGIDGCGGYYAIDVDDEYSPVFYWDHETAAFEEFADTLDAYVEILLSPKPEFFKVLKTAKKNAMASESLSSRFSAWLKRLFK